MTIPVRRIVQHVAVVVLASMLVGWTCVRFGPLECRLFGFSFNPWILAWGIPLGVFIILVVTVRRGRVFCSWLCPTHLFLEGSRWIGHRVGRWRMPARWVFALAAAAFGAQALVTCFAPLDWQLACYGDGSACRLLLVVGGLLLWFAVHFGGLRWRFCVYGCPYGILMRLLKTEDTPVMKFDADSRRCVACRACDRACPYELDVRRQCAGDLCTNCRLCQRACRQVLGDDRCVLALGREDLPH